jgi:hypothetical protein
VLERYRKFLFAGLCAGALGVLIFFAQSAATESAPAYSTWNTTPEGARLLFDGLREAGFVRVSRQFKPVNIEKPRGAAVFFLGVPAYDLFDQDAAFFDAMEAAARRGNKLVIAVPEESTFTFKKPEKKSTLETRWGVRFDSEKGIFSATPIVDKSWKAAGDGVWERNFGSGVIALVGRGQRLSNKGVASKAANRMMLYQLVKNYPAVIFEEAHLGIRETGSIVGLARHYHLQGLMAGLLLLAGLFVWSRSVRFPPAAAAVQERVVAGSDARGMLSELMSRYLKNDLLAVCVAEWNRTRGPAQALVMPAEANAVAAYAAIQRQLQDKKRFQL